MVTQVCFRINLVATRSHVLLCRVIKWTKHVTLRAPYHTININGGKNLCGAPKMTKHHKNSPYDSAATLWIFPTDQKVIHSKYSLLSQFKNLSHVFKLVSQLVMTNSMATNHKCWSVRDQLRGTQFYRKWSRKNAWSWDVILNSWMSFHLCTFFFFTVHKTLQNTQAQWSKMSVSHMFA